MFFFQGLSIFWMLTLGLSVLALLHTVVFLHGGEGIRFENLTWQGFR